MDRRERVIEGLSRCTLQDFSGRDCKGCPYRDMEICSEELKKDALRELTGAPDEGGTAA